MAFAGYDRRTTRYTLDNGDEVNIQIVYYKNISPDPATRFSDGGFGSDDFLSCPTGILPRRVLQPRAIDVAAADESGEERRLTIYIKNNSVFQSIIAGNTDLQSGRPIRYYGESYTVCF